MVHIEFDNTFDIYKTSIGFCFLKEEAGKKYIYGNTHNKYSFQFEDDFIIKNKGIYFDLKKEIKMVSEPFNKKRNYRDGDLFLKIYLNEENSFIINKINLEYDSLYKTILKYHLRNYFFCEKNNLIYIYKRNYNTDENIYYKVNFLNQNGEIKDHVHKDDIETKKHLRMLLQNEFGIGFLKSEDPLRRNDFEYSNSLMTNYKESEMKKREISKEILEKIKEIDEIKKDRVLELMPYLNINKIKKLYLKNITVSPPGGSDYSPIETSSIFLTDEVAISNSINETKILFLI